MTNVAVTDTSGPRVCLPESSPPRPTATATCRPRTWMQQLTEGQTTEPQREGTGSSEHEVSVAETLPEEIPDVLDHQWRVLHPFDLPGVRFPSETTPSNLRRLAENDALVELIQTTEYLDDVPTWGQRDYRLYPPHYGDPFYRGRGRGRGRGGRGRREWLTERQTERPNGGFGRGNGCTIRPQQPVSIERPIPNRQDDEWSSPPPIDERRSDMNRCQTESTSFPAAPPPTEERVFTDWSSEGPPRERSVQPIQTAQVVEPQRTEPDIGELEGEQAIRHRLNEMLTTTSVQVHTDQVGPRYVDRETNTSVVNIRSVDDEEAIVDTIHTHGIGIQMPSISSGLSSSTMDEREFTTEPCLPIRIPQLDGPLSVHTKRKQLVTIIRKQPLISGGDYPSGSESDSHDFRSHKDRRYPGRKGYHQGRGGKPSDKPNRE